MDHLTTKNTMLQDIFLGRFDLVSKHAALNNIALMLENKPVLAMGYWIEKDLITNRFIVKSEYYTGLAVILAEKPCQIWERLMMDSIMCEEKTFVMPFKTSRQANKIATMLNNSAISG